jgi:phosphoadenosine phosphosulfate reductase
VSPPDPLTAAEDSRALGELDRWLESRSAAQRIDWALANCAGPHVLSSSFGAQAAVALHLLTTARPDIPVVLVDTGYLFPETYQFIDTLRERLQLNLHVVQPRLSPGWLEARHGRLWEQGIAGIERYNRLAKVEPMQRALDDLGARTWFAGLRRSQSSTRTQTPIVELRGMRWKVHPIADWSDRDVGRYLARHGLPYHPLWERGYVSIGDVHTTARLEDGMDPQDTRFFGLKRECGIHQEV